MPTGHCPGRCSPGCSRLALSTLLLVALLRVVAPSRRLLLVAALLAATLVAAGVAATTGEASAAAFVLRDLGGGTAQAGADFVDIQLHDRALLAFLGLERARLQSALHDDPSTPLQRFGDVLSHFPPDRAAQEEGLPVLELVRLTVEDTRRRGHGEVRDRSTVGCEAQFGIACQVPDDRDDCFACH